MDEQSVSQDIAFSQIKRLEEQGQEIDWDPWCNHIKCMGLPDSIKWELEWCSGLDTPEEVKEAYEDWLMELDDKGLS